MDTQGVTRDTSRPGDLADASLVRLLPGVGPALRSLRQAGFALVVFTSQGGVARGGYGLREVEGVHDRLRQLLDEAASTPGTPILDGLYYCPMHPTGSVPRFAREHDWRKPAPGMILTAASELGLDLTRSWVVGDKPRDVEAGVRAGVSPSRCVLLATSGERAIDSGVAKGSPFVADLVEATKLILAGSATSAGL
jgi:D-glycero-D-manno-heptose 1,7-bisphosphate phosphatase